MMADIISVLVVLVFVLIVFRKRLAPLFKGRKLQEAAETVESMDAEKSGSEKKADGCTYIHVFAIDISRYVSMLDLSDAIATKLDDMLRDIYNHFVGSFDGVDVITVNGILIFLIRWHT